MNPSDRQIYRRHALDHALAHIAGRGIWISPARSAMLEAWAAGSDDHQAECETWFSALNPRRQRELERASVREILRAWQDSTLSDAEALRLAGRESIAELEEACRSSGVDVATDRNIWGPLATDTWDELQSSSTP